MSTPDHNRRWELALSVAALAPTTGHVSIGSATVLHIDAELARLRAEVEALRKDAERYRWLRRQHWSESPLCVVCDPKEAIKLGYTCPSGEYLDIAVDDEMGRAAIDAAKGGK